MLAVKPEEWAKELAGQEEFFESLAPNVPEELLAEQKKWRSGSVVRQTAPKLSS